jgi:hypothetical protein
MYNGTDIGAAFERLPITFQLEGGVEVHIFKRTRANTADEVAAFSEKLRQFYPDRTYVYESK